MKFDGGSGRPLLFKRVVPRFLDSPREQERCAPMRGALSTSPGDEQRLRLRAHARCSVDLAGRREEASFARPCAVHALGTWPGRFTGGYFIPNTKNPQRRTIRPDSESPVKLSSVKAQGAEEVVCSLES
jgi:hypothetical protein